ncbi:MAG: hypothetical protein AB1422_05190 [bacterium]
MPCSPLRSARGEQGNGDRCPSGHRLSPHQAYKKHWRLIITQLLEKAFVESEDILDKLADETIAEHTQGKTKTIGLHKIIK